MRSVLIMALKDIRLLWRDRFGMFWVVAFPLLMALFFGSIFGSGGSRAGNMKIAVIDEIRTDATADFIEQLKTVEVLTVAPMPLDSARSLVQAGKLAAYVLLKGDSSSGSYNPFTIPPTEIGIDPARRFEAEFLRGMITKAHFATMQNRISDPRKMKPILRSGLAELDTASGLADNERRVLKNLLSSYDEFVDLSGKTDSTASTEAEKFSPFGESNIEVVQITNNRNMPRSAFEITFPQALTWALLGCTLTFALSIVTERTRGTYLRLRLAPVSRGHILAGKGAACLIVNVVVCSALMIFGVLVFGVRIGNPLGLVIAIVSSALCFVGLMMLISVVGRTEQAVGGAGWAVMLVMAMAGGGMVPLMAMPSWMLTISNFSVVKWAIYALEGAVWRGFTMSQMLVPAGALVAVGAVAYIIGVSLLTRFDR